MLKEMYYFKDFEYLGLEDIAKGKVEPKNYQNLGCLKEVRDGLVERLKEYKKNNDFTLIENYERLIDKNSGSPEAGLLSSILLMSADQESKEKFMEIATKEDYGFLGLKADFLSHIKLPLQAMFAQVKEVEFCSEGFYGEIEVGKFSKCDKHCGYYSSGKIGELYDCKGNSFSNFQGSVGFVKECQDQVLRNAKIDDLGVVKYSEGEVLEKAKINDLGVVEHSGDQVLRKAKIDELGFVKYSEGQVLENAKINDLGVVEHSGDQVLREAKINDLGVVKYSEGQVLEKAKINELGSVFFCKGEVLKSAQINNLKRVIRCGDSVLYNAVVDRLGDAKFLKDDVGKFLISQGVEYIANIEKEVFRDMQGKVQYFDGKGVLGKVKAMAFSNRYLRNKFF